MYFFVLAAKSRSLYRSVPYVMDTFDNSNYIELWETLQGKNDFTKISTCEIQEQFCSFCGEDKIVRDNRSGDIICRNCGVILEERMIDNSAEWRNYAGDDNSMSAQKTRCSRINEMFPVSSSSSVFRTSRPELKHLEKLSLRGSIPYSEKMLMDVKNEFSHYLGDSVPLNIQQQALCIYKEYKTSINPRTKKAPINRGKNRTGILAACIHKAHINASRTISASDLARYFKCNTSVIKKGESILNQYVKDASSRVIETDPQEYVTTYCTALGLPPSFIKDIQEIAEKIVSHKDTNKKLQSSKPNSIAAGCLWYIISENNLDPPFSKKIVSQITGVSDVTFTTICDIICKL